MATLREVLAAELAQLKAAGLYRVLRDVESPQGKRIVVGGRSLLNFSSNDYLGLTNDAALQAVVRDAVARWGVGAGASRLVCGNLAPYAQLEAALARFKRKAAAVVFGSGYAANVGTITALVGEGDVVVLDKLNHASIIDGARQSGATIRVYPHRNMRKLAEILRQSQGARRVLVVTETVFSMDGDRAPLVDIVELKKQFGAWLMVDEAHATGVLGANRRGLAEEMGIEDEVEVTVGTLSKALGCVGGFVAGAEELADYLRNKARSLIYSTALPPALVATATHAVELVMGTEGKARQDRLWQNVRQWGGQSAIQPVIVGDEVVAVQLAERLLERGYFVPAIRYPTVPRGQARLRVTLTAEHTAGEIEELRNEIAR